MLTRTICDDDPQRQNFAWEKPSSDCFVSAFFWDGAQLESFSTSSFANRRPRSLRTTELYYWEVVCWVRTTTRNSQLFRLGLSLKDSKKSNLSMYFLDGKKKMFSVYHGPALSYTPTLMWRSSPNGVAPFIALSLLFSFRWKKMYGTKCRFSDSCTTIRAYHILAYRYIDVSPHLTPRFLHPSQWTLEVSLTIWQGGTLEGSASR